MTTYLAVSCVLLVQVPGLLSDEYCNSGYPQYKYTRCNGHCCKEQSDGCCEDMADIPLIAGCVVGTVILLAVIVTMVIIICHKKVKEGRVIHPPPLTHNTLMFNPGPFVASAPPSYYYGPPPPYPGSPIPPHTFDTCNNVHFEHAQREQSQQPLQQLQQQQHVLQQQQHHSQQQQLQQGQQQQQGQQRRQRHERQFRNIPEAFVYQDQTSHPLPVNSAVVLPVEDPPPYYQSIASDRL